MEIDETIGAILDRLNSLSITNDTFIFFSSDNGAATYAGVKGHYIEFNIKTNGNAFLDLKNKL